MGSLPVVWEPELPRVPEQAWGQAWADGADILLMVLRLLIADEPPEEKHFLHALTRQAAAGAGDTGTQDAASAPQGSGAGGPTRQRHW